MHRGLLLTLAQAACWSAAVAFAVSAAPAIAQEQVIVQADDVSAGVLTVPELDRTPPAFRVYWINWDSPFRTTALEIGDRIIGLNGQLFTLPQDVAGRQRFSSRAIGQVSEPTFWTELGKGDGQPITLTVERRGNEQGTLRLDIPGAIAAKRQYINTQTNRHLVGSGGPPEILTDGFGDAWSTWYDKFMSQAQDALDGGWDRRTFNNREALAAFRQNDARIDYLKTHYPGLLTERIAADYQTVTDSLVGKAYTLPPGALDFRQLGEQRSAQIATKATEARALFIASLTDRIELPSINPLQDDSTSVVGKIIVLPAILPGDWVNNLDRNWLVSCPADKSCFFVSEDHPAMTKLFAAMRRYRSAVSPDLEEHISIIGKIMETPQMLVRNNGTLRGFEVAPIAASVDDKLFLELTGDAPEPLFAGEADIVAPTPPDLADDATPRQVMEAYIAALKAGDRPRWDSLFATWRASNWGTSNHAMYEPYAPFPHDFEWVDSRRAILGKVADARVVYVGAPEVVLSDAEIPGAPRIEQVTVTIDHIGAFDDGYRSFVDVTVHRDWTLQRRDNGPWRVTSVQAL